MDKVNFSSIQGNGDLNLKSLSDQLEALSSMIKDPPKNVSELKYNLSIKEQMIKIANQMGDSEKVSKLKEEANSIKSDIAKNTSVFD